MNMKKYVKRCINSIKAAEKFYGRKVEINDLGTIDLSDF